MAQEQRVDVPLVPEQGPNFISSVVTMDDPMFTALLSLSSRVSATSWLDHRALFDTESPQSFTYEGVFN